MAAAFKSGPDYIDPLFHSRVLQTASHNLDLFLFGRGEQGAATARYLLAAGSSGADAALIEGAMGYYDASARRARPAPMNWLRPRIRLSSSSSTAPAQACPWRLKLKGRRLSAGIAGLPGLSSITLKPGVYAYFKDVWEKETGLTAFGCFPDMAGCAFASRHLGLVTAGEIEDFRSKIDA